ncbi:hypothetical protein JCM16307_17610 [Thermococcus prieurii]
MKKVELYDTTLRDGSQMEGISFSLEDKLRITEKLDEFGIHYIEGGWPGSNPKDIEYFRAVGDLSLENARIASLWKHETAEAKARGRPEPQRPRRLRGRDSYDIRQELGPARQGGPEDDPREQPRDDSGFNRVPPRARHARFLRRGALLRRP